MTKILIGTKTYSMRANVILIKKSCTPLEHNHGFWVPKHFHRRAWVRRRPYHLERCLLACCHRSTRVPNALTTNTLTRALIAWAYRKTTDPRCDPWQNAYTCLLQVYNSQQYSTYLWQKYAEFLVHGARMSDLPRFFPSSGSNDGQPMRNRWLLSLRPPTIQAECVISIFWLLQSWRDWGVDHTKLR